MKGVETSTLASRVPTKSSIWGGGTSVWGVEQCRFCVGCSNILRGLKLSLGLNELSFSPTLSHTSRGFRFSFEVSKISFRVRLPTLQRGCKDVAGMGG